MYGPTWPVLSRIALLDSAPAYRSRAERDLCGRGATSPATSDLDGYTRDTCVVTFVLPGGLGTCAGKANPTHRPWRLPRCGMLSRARGDQVPVRRVTRLCVRFETAPVVKAGDAGEMNSTYARRTLAMLWSCSVLVGGSLGLANSLPGWITLAFVALGPPAILQHLWREPGLTTSQQIQASLR